MSATSPQMASTSNEANQQQGEVKPEITENNKPTTTSNFARRKNSTVKIQSDPATDSATQNEHQKTTSSTKPKREFADASTDSTDLDSCGAQMDVYIPLHISGDGVSRTITKSKQKSATERKQSLAAFTSSNNSGAAPSSSNNQSRKQSIAVGSTNDDDADNNQNNGELHQTHNNTGHENSNNHQLTRKSFKWKFFDEFLNNEKGNTN